VHKSGIDSLHGGAVKKEKKKEGRTKILKISCSKEARTDRPKIEISDHALRKGEVRRGMGGGKGGNVQKKISG